MSEKHRKIDVDRIVADARKLFSDQLWTLNLNTLSNTKRKLVRFIKLIRIILDSFSERKMAFQCVALSYYGALATIPLVALVFSVTGGLGFDGRVSSLLFKYIPADPVILNTLLDKATNIIDAARSGGVGLVSALIFLWTVIWLMYQIERVFNNVWGVRKLPRKLYMRVLVYFAALLLLPFVVLIFASGITVYSNVFSLIGLNYREASIASQLLGFLIFYVIIVFTLSAMYKFIPAVKVVYRYAFQSALVSGAVFLVFQYLYLETQMFVSRLNAVYGVIAAIPLFLIWMNYSWQIVIYGAQLTYGLQNIDTYNIPEGRLKDFTPMLDRLTRKARKERKELKEREEQKEQKEAAV